MMVAPILIPVHQASDVWPLVLPFIERVVRRHPDDFTVDGLFASAVNGTLRLWLLWEPDAKVALAAVGIKVEIGLDGSLIGRPLFCDGRDRLKWQEQIVDAAEEWMRSEGVENVKILSRLGWGSFLRKKGYRATHVMFERAL